jgi:hypothetical protein
MAAAGDTTGEGPGAPAPPPVILVDTGRYVTATLAAVKLGLTIRAVDGKRYSGVWIEGQEWRKAPDGSIWYDMREIEKWVEKGQAA